jgi:hypothetical protein
VPTPLLHIGYHKTGSVWLRQALFTNGRAGFVHPWRRNEITERLVLPNALDFCAEETAAWFRSGLDAASTSGRVPVASHERLSGNPHAGGYDSRYLAERLAAVFPDARVLIVVREQRGAIVSNYKQYVRVGGRTSIRRYLSPPQEGRTRIPLFDLRHFEYDRLIAVHQKLFGRDRVLVLPFELLRHDPMAFLAATVDFAGPPASMPPTVDRAERNQALSALSTGLKRRANVLVRDTLNPTGLVEHAGLNKRLVAILEGVDGRVPRDTRQRWEDRLTAAVSGAAGDRFAASNRRTSELTGLDLAGYGYES